VRICYYYCYVDVVVVYPDHVVFVVVVYSVCYGDLLFFDFLGEGYYDLVFFVVGVHCWAFRACVLFISFWMYCASSLMRFGLS